ncbi:hypothetical protein PULV_a3204 [Pseudoalteromonas ulvae UL12]|nr:hypothetical protein [Pseudoalteromonas ulvae UL12]
MFLVTTDELTFWKKRTLTPAISYRSCFECGFNVWRSLY